VLPVRITENEFIIYSVTLDEITRHMLVPRTQTGVRQTHKNHHRTSDPASRERELRQRFEQLGPIAVQFFEGLLTQHQGKQQAQQTLVLSAHYRREDVLRAFERAVRFGAFSAAAVRRILAADAKPRPLLDELAELHGQTLDPSLRHDAVGPRPTSAYQHLLHEEATDDRSCEQESKDKEEHNDDLTP
jgi:hypothetical protein